MTLNLYLVNNTKNENILKAAASSLTAQFYNGIENILKRVCKYLNVTLPKDEFWHIKLFNWFCEPRHEELPVLFDDYLIEELTNYRRFRHFVFHGYSNKISIERLKEGISNISIVFNRFETNLYCYLDSI